MPFLKKLGTVLLAATDRDPLWRGDASRGLRRPRACGDLVVGFRPPLSGGVGVPSSHAPVSDLSQIAGVVAQAEVMGQTLALTGAQKVEAVAPLVAQILLQSDLLKDRSIADKTLFAAGCARIAGGMADVLNALADDVPAISKL